MMRITRTLSWRLRMQTLPTLMYILKSSRGYNRYIHEYRGVINKPLKGMPLILPSPISKAIRRNQINKNSPIRNRVQFNNIQFHFVTISCHLRLKSENILRVLPHTLFIQITTIDVLQSWEISICDRTTNFTICLAISSSTQGCDKRTFGGMSPHITVSNFEGYI